ncbi:MAG: translation elongation factor Ts [Candidatus Sumerlaeia bacterium]|nr:translation elongation factor Ts [Candidatus Sumerlaeia bacterium]
MAEITASLVKELRDRTQLGMADCKKALVEADGDMDAAVRILRERGAIKAAKRADRNATEGLVATAISADHKSAAMAQLNCETDFVSRNDDFQILVKQIAEAGLKTKADSMDSILAAALPSGKTVKEEVEDIAYRIGEKIELGSYSYVQGEVVAGYIHPPGKIGVLVKADGKINAANAAQASDELRRGVAMHVAAFAPRFLDATQVDAETLNQEREIYATQLRNEGKPENMIENIVNGKVKSFYKDNCLVDQASAQDPKKTVAQVVTEIAKAAGGDLKLSGFVRTNIGSAN